MRIAQVAPPFEAIPPSGYGGTERVVATLTEQLVRRGHDVTLFAAGDSRTSARLVSTAKRALWHEEPPVRDFAPWWAMTIDVVAQQMEAFDVVHSHIDFWGFPLARAASAPVITTLHGRLDLPELRPLYRHFDDVPLVSISDAQRRPVRRANWVATVYHGIDLGELTFNPRPGAYLAFLGRIAPEKGLDTAIRAARAAGMPLKIAAREPLPHTQDPNVRRDWEYYDGVVRPLLNQPGIELVGEVEGPGKDEFLRNAAALLFPICWPEPFGLVMAEALACGTPVIALRHGSVPEVVENGVTGFVCRNEAELVRAVGRLGDIDRRACREAAERRYSPHAMATAYEHVYAELLRRRSLEPVAEEPVPIEVLRARRSVSGMRPS